MKTNINLIDLGSTPSKCEVAYKSIGYEKIVRVYSKPHNVVQSIEKLDEPKNQKRAPSLGKKVVENDKA